MDTKELMMMMMLKMDNHHHTDVSSDPFSSLPLGNSTSASADEVDHKASLGFMELLGFQDYYSSSSSIFDDSMTYQSLPPPPPPPLPSSSLSMKMVKSTSAQPVNHDDNGDTDLDHHNHKDEITTFDEVAEESSVVLNGQPSSPNSSSISSPAHQQLQKPLKQCMKGKKTMDGDEAKPKKNKKEKEARFAFMTRTEIDHLDDGYRWRKYGQKAVKNSHFPRSYYRCTSASCNVKKRVERCMGDSSYVITTYEGKHNHPVALSSAPIIPSFSHLISATTATAAATTNTMPQAMLKLEQGGLLQDMLHCYY